MVRQKIHGEKSTAAHVPVNSGLENGTKKGPLHNIEAATNYINLHMQDPDEENPTTLKRTIGRGWPKGNGSFGWGDPAGVEIPALSKFIRVFIAILLKQTNKQTKSLAFERKMHKFLRKNTRGQAGGHRCPHTAGVPLPHPSPAGTPGPLSLHSRASPREPGISWLWTSGPGCCPLGGWPTVASESAVGR